MNNIFRLLFTFYIIFGWYTVSNAQKIILKQTKESGIYKKGEKIEVSVLLEGTEVDSISVRLEKNYGGNAVWQKMRCLKKRLVLFEGDFNEPTSMIFEVRAGENYAGTGFVVEPENLKPATKRPKDFDKYWKDEKAALKALPLETKKMPVNDIESGFLCSDVEINCTGSKPVRGYFAKPVKAIPGSLPIVLNLHAAGVKGSWCLARTETALRYAKMGKGTLSFDLNAHGMLNGQPQEYYDNLEAGELKNYARIGIESRNEYYFRGMYLRLLRTLDFLCSQPEWDGKRIIVIGESQGGGQALAAAGLDQRVTAAVATVPAMCDFGRTLIEEKGGWPNPFGQKDKNKEKLLNVVPYFDDVHILKNSKATLVTEIGLIDFTCPSIGIYAAINQSNGKKITLAVPYRGHHQNQPAFQKKWQESVYQTKMKFIADFLK